MRREWTHGGYWRARRVQWQRLELVVVLRPLLLLLLLLTMMMMR